MPARKKIDILMMEHYNCILLFWLQLYICTLLVTVLDIKVDLNFYRGRLSTVALWTFLYCAGEAIPHEGDGKRSEFQPF